MWELDCEEGWAPKNWCFWTVVFEKTLESPLDCKEIQPVHPKGDQPWDFFGRNDANAETPVLWPPHVKSWLTGKDSDAGRDWGQEEKGTTEDEMAGWYHWLNGCESVYSRSWWWTGRPGILQFKGSQRVRHDWVTELNWTERNTVKGFGIVNEAEIDVFLELSCFSDNPTDVYNLISGSSPFLNQLEHLEVHSLHTVEAWLGEFWALLY